MAYKYDKYKDEILKLHHDGHSSRVIAKYLNKKYPNDNLNDSSVNKFIKRKLGDDYKANFQFSGSKAASQTSRANNIVDEIMQNSGFTEGVNAKGVMVWDKSNKDYSILYKMVKDVMSFDQMRDDMRGELKKYTPNFKKIKRKVVKDPHLLVIDIADLHIGKLCDTGDAGDSYNHEIAYQRAIEGVEGLLAKANGFPIDKILFVLGNDILHTDNSTNTTTKGTGQDVSQKWFKNFELARKLYVKIIERLLGFADIHIVHNMSNHDYISGYMLADAVYCWFHKCKGITWDIDASDRKYFKYGSSLIGTAHGDNGKMDSLPLSMSMEAKEHWATSSTTTSICTTFITNRNTSLALEKICKEFL